MASDFDFDFYRAGSGSLLGHGLYIAPSLLGVGILNGCSGALDARRTGRLSRDGQSCMSFRRQVPSGALSDSLETSNISTDSREPPYPSYRFTLPRILIPVALRGRAAIVIIGIRWLIVHIGIVVRGMLYWASSIHNS